MEEEDHYKLLGLPSGTEGAKISAADIRKAYRSRALVFHPDKRPDDPNAAAFFQKIQNAYEILSDDKGRQAYDELLRLKEKKKKQHEEFEHRSSQISAKRRKMMDDLREKEKAYEAEKQKDEHLRAEEERAAKKLQEEIARIRAMHAEKRSNFSYFSFTGVKVSGEGSKEEKGKGLDKAKMLKATWSCVDGRGDYSAERLREIFEKFGTVEDVVIRRKDSKKKGSAIVVMKSKEQVDAATQNLCGDVSNPLLVLPLLPSSTNIQHAFESKQEEADNDKDLNNVVGAGYHAYEDGVLKKLQKAAEKARLNKQAQQ